MFVDWLIAVSLGIVVPAIASGCWRRAGREYDGGDIAISPTSHRGGIEVGWRRGDRRGMTPHAHALRAGLVVSLLAVVAAPSAAQTVKGPEGRALERALKLLPQPPSVPVRFIDPELAADPEAIRRVDAFLVRESNNKIRPVIYLNRRSALVENAIAGKDIDVAILAAVIRHEQEHLRGANEEQARRAERDFFLHLVQGGRVPVDEGIAYLDVLHKHYRLREGP